MGSNGNVVLTSLGTDMLVNSKLTPVENGKIPHLINTKIHSLSTEDYHPEECNGKMLLNGKAHHDDTTHFEVEVNMKLERERKSVLKKVREKRLIEKIVYVTSVGTISLLTHSLVSAQYLIPYYYTVSTPILLLLRTIMYCLCKWQLFLLDFCYYGNIMCYVFIWAVPQQPEFFCVLFALTNGPMLWSLILFRNSIVLHSFDKMVSVFTHLMPSLISFTLRWYPGQASRMWYTEFMPEFKDWSFIWLIAIPLGCFIAHSMVYTILVMYILKPSEEYTTIYRLLTMKQESLCFRSFNVLGPRYRYWIYKLYYWGFCLVSLVFTLLWYNYFIAHCIFVIFVTVLATWNGACYYLEVFSVRDKANRAKLKQADPER